MSDPKVPLGGGQDGVNPKGTFQPKPGRVFSSHAILRQECTSTIISSLNGGMAKGRRRPEGIRTKTISAQGIAGQQGVNFIEKILLKMGSRWTPSGANEVGIDGYIELFDPTSRVSLGLTLAVQSKVVSSIREVAEEFRYSCDASDLEYWLKGNIPVILIVSDPETEQGYWVWIQEVFKEWRPGQSPSVLFEKSRDRFHSDSLTDLVRVGAPLRGLYLPPRPKPERLWSNLLRVDALPTVLFVAETALGSRAEVWAEIKKRKASVESGWILWERKILSFEDLSTRAWADICEPGTVERFQTAEWSESDDREKRRLFVQLLNRTLRAQLYYRLRYWPKEDCFAMTGESRKQSYQSLKRSSGLTVVSQFSSQGKDGRTFDYRRHLAFRGQFRRLDGEWYLEVTPTYRFTHDGERRDRFHESRLKKIKELEGNRAVLSCVLFWADFLQPEKGLFADPQPPIVFGELKTINVGVGIDDKSWKQNDPDTASLDEQSDQQGLLLLE